MSSQHQTEGQHNKQNQQNNKPAAVTEPIKGQVTLAGLPQGFISGNYQVAIECKFTEAEVGCCSRPLLRPSASNYDTDLCDGTFTRQRSRQERCSLTEIGVLYWKYVPELFEWSNEIDLSPCPLFKNYQLVRNILAACVRPDGTLLPENGHVLLIYDERNPAFQAGGPGFFAFAETRQALKVAGVLKKCSWQRYHQASQGKSYSSLADGTVRTKIWANMNPS